PECPLAAQLAPQGLVIADELDGRFDIGKALADLDERVALVALFAEQTKQLAIGIRARAVLPQCVDVTVADIRPEHLERAGDAALLDVLGIGVPRQADRLVAAVFHDRLAARRLSGAVAVNLDLDLDPGILGRLAALDQRLADLL